MNDTIRHDKDGGFTVIPEKVNNMEPKKYKVPHLIINEHIRFAAALRRFQFECIKSLGVFWLIERIPWLNIKEPWNKLYKRANK